jgi:hypothetical protein
MPKLRAQIHAMLIESTRCSRLLRPASSAAFAQALIRGQ